MIEGIVATPLLLEVALSDGAAASFPRVRLYDSLGVLVTTVDAVHVANGLYRATWTPFASGDYAAHFIVYTDAGHTALDATYDRVVDHVLVRKLDQDTVFQKLLGHLGENVRDDVLSYDGNNRPLSFRRRIFATKAAAIASTPGGTGEGEIFTVVGSALHFDAAKWETLVRTLEP